MILDSLTSGPFHHSKYPFLQLPSYDTTVRCCLFTPHVDQNWFSTKWSIRINFWVDCNTNYVVSFLISLLAKPETNKKKTWIIYRYRYKECSHIVCVRYLVSVIVGAIVAVVVGATIYGFVLPSVMDGELPDVMSGAADVASDVIDGAADTVDGAADTAGGVVDTTIGTVDSFIDEDVPPKEASIPGAQPLATEIQSEEEWEAGTAMPKSFDAEEAAPIFLGEKLRWNDTGVKVTTEHRYVKSPPCTTFLTSDGKETREMFGIPIPIPRDNPLVNEHAPDWLRILDAQQAVVMGLDPKPCHYDDNGNGLGDGWEDSNKDGYADGFTDCTRPYVYTEEEGGWWGRQHSPQKCTFDYPDGKVWERPSSMVTQSENSDYKDGNQNNKSSTKQPVAQDDWQYKLPSTTTRESAKSAPVTTPMPYATAQTGTVTRVIDGDTLQVDRETTIRLALVDTPERGELGYEEASSFTRLKCPVGTTVVYDADDGQKEGSYGRLIAMVWCTGHGTNAAVSLNDLLLVHGFAEIDKRFCSASEFGDDEWAKRGGC